MQCHDDWDNDTNRLATYTPDAIDYWKLNCKREYITATQELEASQPTVGGFLFKDKDLFNYQLLVYQCVASDDNKNPDNAICLALYPKIKQSEVISACYLNTSWVHKDGSGVVFEQPDKHMLHAELLWHYSVQEAVHYKLLTPASYIQHDNMVCCFDAKKTHH